MKIGLVSDSHGHTADLKRAVDEMGEVDLIFHMGDYIQDSDLIRQWTNTPVMAVKGNMDSYERNRPEFIKTQVGDHTIYVCHGHKENVKWEKDSLMRQARRNHCDLVFYGHTHRKDFTKKRGVTIINPGSCAIPNDGSKSYAIVTLDGKNIDCQFYELEDE